MLFGLAFLGLGKARVRRGIATTNVRISQKDIRPWRGDDPREAFRGGSRSKSGWRAHRVCATI
jgi:hypothetical protein